MFAGIRTVVGSKTLGRLMGHETTLDGDGYTLHLGDSAEVLRTLPSESVDLTVTSPPYDNLRTYNGYSFDFETIARELWRLTKPGGVVVGTFPTQP